jgi:hypothetical protein
MLCRFHVPGNGCGPLEFYILLLPVAKAEAIALKASGTGNSQDRSGVQAAAEENNCFSSLLVHPLLIPYSSFIHPCSLSFA